MLPGSTRPARPVCVEPTTTKPAFSCSASSCSPCAGETLGIALTSTVSSPRLVRRRSSSSWLSPRRYSSKARLAARLGWRSYGKTLTSMSSEPVMPARLLARAIASLEPCDSSTPTMIVLMTVLSDGDGMLSGVRHDGGVRRMARCDWRARDDHDGTARLAHDCSGDVVEERAADRPVAARTDEEQVDHAVRSASDLLCGHAVDEQPLGLETLRRVVEDPCRRSRTRSVAARGSARARRRSRRSGQRGVRARATQPRGARRPPRASRRRRRRSGECLRRCIRAAPPRPGTGRRGAGARRSCRKRSARARCGGSSRRRRGRRALPRPLSAGPATASRRDRADHRPSVSGIESRAIRSASSVSSPQPLDFVRTPRTHRPAAGPVGRRRSGAACPGLGRGGPRRGRSLRRRARVRHSR